MKFDKYLRLPFLTRISGGHENTVYLDRIALTPYTPFGQLLLHIFWRGDADQDPHDHPFDFWTMPLTSYDELELDPRTGDMLLQTVSAWSWHARPAEHTHRVLYRTHRPGATIFTLVWRRPRRRSWGFWQHDDGSRDARLPRRFGRVFVPWRVYLGLRPNPLQSPDLWVFEKRRLDLFAWHPELGQTYNLFAPSRPLDAEHRELMSAAIDEYNRRRKHGE